MRSVVVLVATLVVTVGMGVVTGAAHPVRVPGLVVVSVFALIFGARALGAMGVQRAVGSRPGEIVEEGNDGA